VLCKREMLCGWTLCCAAVLSGCGMGTVASGGGGGTITMSGQVEGGQQGVSGSTIQLYTVGATGNGSAATPMLTEAVTTDAGGSFSISNAYTCGDSGASNQVYIVATGGNPGQTSGTDNKALVMVAALGPCSNLSTTPNIFINELTTVAAAWALAPFTASAGSIGASPSNAAGIENAFLDAGLLANTINGTPATLPSNLAIETGKLNALADAIAGCVNSDGTTACSPLFTAATVGSSTPTDTFTAALNIVKHPGQNVMAVYKAIGTYVPFATTLTQAPNDWTMSLTVTGGGLDMPTALGIDSQNNIWVANQDGPLSAFNAQGNPLSSTGFGLSGGVTQITQVSGLAIDPSDNIWVTNYNAGYNPAGALTEFLGASSGSTGSVVLSGGNPGFTGDSCYPTAVAADTNGDLFVTNEECSSANVYNSSGAIVSSYLGETYNLMAVPQFIAADSNHGFWLSDNDNTIAHISAPTAAYPNGQLLSHPDCCTNSHGLALDAQGNVWVADYLGSSFSEVGGDGSVLINQATGGGVVFPYALAIDAGQNVWLTNFDNGSISEIAGSGETLKAGTPISPSTGGLFDIGGYGYDAALGEPFSIAPDRSGNLWVSNQGAGNLVMFFGLATPTVTPLSPVPTAP
jgi:streptogramin lyase